MLIWFIIVAATCFVGGDIYGTWRENRRLTRMFGLVEILGVELAKGNHDAESIAGQAD